MRVSRCEPPLAGTMRGAMEVGESMKQPEVSRHRNHRCSPSTARASHRRDVAFLHPPSVSGELKANLPSFKRQKPNNDRIVYKLNLEGTSRSNLLP